MISPTTRIVLNAAATYGRSLLALMLGLFSARWVLMALGKEDLGLFGVVGSVLFCITFINSMLSTAVSRFYAFSVGEEKSIGGERGRDCVVRWFNVAVSVHFVLPIVLIVLGGPVGLYALHHWLVIPTSRMPACEAIFFMSLSAAFFNIISVPFVSLYRAYQLITELSFWGVISTLLTFCGAALLLYVECDHLVLYGAIMSGVSILINVIQMVRARIQFPVCRLRWEYMFCGECIKQLFSYSFWEFFGVVGDVIRGQGTVFLINRHLGIALNAAYSIGNQVCGQAQSLASAMLGALEPAVATSVGRGDRRQALELAYRCSKFCSLLVLLFCIPITLEIDEVLRIWLVNPPEGTAVICRCILIAFVCHKLGIGQHILVCSYGRISGMQFCLGLISAATIALVFVNLTIGNGMFGVGLSFIVSFSMLTIVRTYFARRLCGMSITLWIRSVVLPIGVVAAASWFSGRLVCVALRQTVVRVCLTTTVSVIVASLASYIFALSVAEKSYLRTALLNFARRIKRE